MAESDKGFQAVILAAGRGSRMGSDLPKVLLPVCGKPMLMRILDVLSEVGISSPVVVIGKNGEKVREVIGRAALYAVQEEQLGSGHAVICAREAARGSRHVIIMCGDSPLFTSETIRKIMETHSGAEPAVTLATAALEDPSGYGRILRRPDGDVAGVVEEKLASEEQRAIKDINGGCYAFNADWLWGNLDRMQRNEVGEYCLTEMVDIAIAQGRRVIAVDVEPEEVLGVNTPEQLRQAEEVLRDREIIHKD